VRTDGELMMKQFTFTAIALASGLLLAAPSFAQSTSTNPQNGMSNQPHNGMSAQQQSGTSTQQYSGSAQKQKTQSDPTNTYMFKPESGNYAARPQKQQ
jgi:hypothetical protein